MPLLQPVIGGAIIQTPTKQGFAMKKEEVDANTVITRLGGTCAVARLCEVKQPSVSEWRANNAIPKARAMFLKAIRPDVFKEKFVEKEKKKK